MTGEVKRTRMAQAALEASDLLNMRFANRPIGVNPPRKLMVAAPDGPSTDGGRKVRQSIVLSPTVPSNVGQVMVGWLDISQKRAELRVHALVTTQFEQRYHQSFDITVEAYDVLMRDVRSMLTAQDIVVTVVDALPVAKERPSAPEPAEEETGSTKVAMLVGGLLIAAAGLAAAIFLAR